MQNERKTFTEGELKVIREMFADNYTGFIADLLNRSYQSVACQAYKMGLQKSDVFKRNELTRQGKIIAVTGAKTRKS